MRLAPAVAALLVASASGAAWAQIDNTAIPCGSSATYYPFGHRWVRSANTSVNPIDVYGVGYHQHTVGSADISNATEQDAVDRAADAWTYWSCPGSTNASVALGRDTDSPTAPLEAEEENYILWIESSTTWNAEFQGSSTTIAMTTTSSYPDGAYIVDADMAFNGANYQFRAKASDGSGNPTGSYTGCSSGSTCYDVESVALHEFGHFLGFNHVQCTDALMYPSGTPTGGFLDLTHHEGTGLCAVYPPRNTSSTSAEWGEFCDANADCNTGTNKLCIISPDYPGHGWCTKSCTADTDCPTAYKCELLDITNLSSQKYCKPGLRASAVADTPVAADPETGDSLDMCSLCTDGNQCSNGICVAPDEESETGICTILCEGNENCPSDMECFGASETDDGVCWPTGNTCNGGSPGQLVNLNELCYLNINNNEQFAPCAAGLICAVFPSIDGVQQGACVPVCSTGADCPDDYQTCCFGVDNAGHCVETAGSSSFGACFEIQNEGEPCVLAEQSICQDDLICTYFNYDSCGNNCATLAKCYQLCAGDDDCENTQTCIDNVADICCDTGDLEDEICTPGANDKLGLGVECHENSDCDSNLCLRHDGEAACSRSCNAVTQSGCPNEDADTTGDGRADGGFDCISVQGEGRCWPNDGPLGAPQPDAPKTDPGGCFCAASPAVPLDWAWAAGVWGMLLVGWRRRASGRGRSPS